MSESRHQNRIPSIGSNQNVALLVAVAALVAEFIGRHHDYQPGIAAGPATDRDWPRLPPERFVGIIAIFNAVGPDVLGLVVGYRWDGRKCSSCCSVQVVLCSLALRVCMARFPSRLRFARSHLCYGGGYGILPVDDGRFLRAQARRRNPGLCSFGMGFCSGRFPRRL